MDKTCSIKKSSLESLMATPREFLGIPKEAGLSFADFPNIIESAMSKSRYEGYEEGIKQGGESYDIGYSNGYNEGTENGIEIGIGQGKQQAYDEQWDNYQDFGNRTDCRCMFGGIGWNVTTMKPKYGIPYITNAYMMFAQCGYNGDLDDVFENRGLPLSFKDCGNVEYLFHQTNIPTIGTVDLSGYTGSVASMFNSTNIVTIKNFVPPSVSMANSCFQSGLTNLTIGGEITKSINLSRCTKLTSESVQSVLDHLADLTGQTTQTITLPSAIGKALTEEQKALITARNWTLAY